MADTELAWHFVSADRKLRDGRPLVVGKWLQHTGDVVMCTSGLHASTRVLDALQYAPSPVVCLVEVGNIVALGSDKLVCRSRKPLWCIDATEALGLFTRQVALSVADKWNCPAVVREWLETGNEEIRSAARSAAWSAARSAAWSAARSAAYSAASSAASSAAYSAASSAAYSAAYSGAWSGAWSAAYSGANDLLESILLGIGQP